MSKRSPLGRGLANLIPGANAPVDMARPHSPYQEIPLDRIRPNPAQPRRRFEEKEINELAQTLHTVGVIEPVVVRPMALVSDGESSPGGPLYQLISGERRWRACRLAGFQKVPAVVRTATDLQALEMGLIENLQREELNPVEEARAYDAWVRETGRKPGELADKVGKDRSTVTNLLRLLRLPPEVLELLETKRLTAGQARPLLGVGDRKALLRLAGKVAAEGWSARRVEDEVARLDPSRRAGAREQEPSVAKLEERLRARFTARAVVSHKKSGGGRITLHYSGLADLERILELMGVRQA